MTTRTVRLDADQPEGLTLTELLAVDAAIGALDRSVNLSTGLRVGAAALTSSGHVYPGVQIGLTIPSAICAEQSAVATAISCGAPHVRGVFLVSVRVDEPVGGLLPCGRCLQLLNDVQTYNRHPITIYSLDMERSWVEIIPLTDLIPRPFRSRKLDQAGESPSP